MYRDAISMQNLSVAKMNSPVFKPEMHYVNLLTNLYGNRLYNLARVLSNILPNHRYAYNVHV
jgi:hypothetical protein